MLNVHHKIKINDTVWSATEHSRLFELTTSAGMDIPVNTCRLTMAPPKGVSAAPGDEIKVELGYNDELELVFSGQIERVDWSVDVLTIRGAGRSRNLLASYINLLFEKPTAGDIVEDLCKKAEVETAEVEAGLNFDFYTVGERSSAYEHLKQLAQKCGFDLYANPEDQLVFAAYRGQNSHLFQMAVNIIDLKIGEPEKPIGKVEVYGESPSSLGEGTEAAYWFTKKEVKGSADGGGALNQYVYDPSVRTQDAAAQVADNILKYRKNKKKGWLKALGKADVRLGDSIGISKMTNEAQNGSYKITQVVHRLSSHTGFITKLQIEEN